MNTRQLASFAELNREELAADGITAADLLHAFESGRAVLEARVHAFAVVQLRDEPDGDQAPHLWLLFVDPEHRGQGVGRELVREIVRKYSADRHMSLYCKGSVRRAFFGRLGFVVESRDGDMRRMTTNRAFYR